MPGDQSPIKLSAEERRRKLEIGLRRNKSRLQAPNWMATLSSLLGIPIGEDMLVSLEESDRLREAFYERLKTTDVLRHYWYGRPTKEVSDALQLLNAQPSLQVLLFSHEEDCTLAVRVPIGPVLTNAIQYIGDNRRDVALATPSFDAGLLFGLSHHGHTPTGDSKDEYEVRTWGSFAELSKGIKGARSVSRWDFYRVTD